MGKSGVGEICFAICSPLRSGYARGGGESTGNLDWKRIPRTRRDDGSIGLNLLLSHLPRITRMDGAPLFVLVDASRKVKAGPSLRFSHELLFIGPQAADPSSHAAVWRPGKSSFLRGGKATNPNRTKPQNCHLSGG